MLFLLCSDSDQGPSFFFFFFNDTATTEIYTLSLHDALPILHPELVPRARREDPVAHGDAASPHRRAPPCRHDEHRARSRAGEGRVDLSLAEVAPERWDGLLEELGLDDAYLLHEYVQASALLDPGRPVLLHLHDGGGDVVFACIVREVDGGKADVTTPYGYGGPVVAGPDPPVESFWREYERWCENGGVVTTFLRFHPLYANQRAA